MTNMNEYQELASKTNIYPNTTDGFYAQALGLCSESGEVAGKIKKVIRDSKGNISSGAKEQIKSELGDVLWYVSQCANALGLSLGEVAEHNIRKLSDRNKRNKIGGSGDER